MVPPGPPASPSSVPSAQNLTPTPLFTAFYVCHPDPGITAALESSTDLTPRCKPYLIPPTLPPTLPLPDITDTAATHAEIVFWEAVKALREDGIIPTQDSGCTYSDESPREIESFWPVVDTGEESEEEE